MVPVYYNDGSILTYEVNEGKTLRHYIENKNGIGTVKRTGIVTADASAFMYMPANIKETQIQIDGKIYDFNGIAPRGYLGQKVDFYVLTDTLRNDLIISIAPDIKNTIHDFLSEEVVINRSPLFNKASQGPTYDDIKVGDIIQVDDTKLVERTWNGSSYTTYSVTWRFYNR
jgi:hypothetical protein